ILPLFVSAIAWGVYGESLSVGRRLGIGLIVIGIGAFLWHSLFFSPWRVTQGHLILLAAGISWAWFTIGVRVTGLNAAEAGAVGAMSGLVSFNLRQAPLGELGYHVLAQGLGVGIIANYSYAFAIRRLGAEMSAAIGAFTPVVAALIAIPVFSETVSTLTVVAMALIVLGAMLASEGIKWRRTQTKSGPQAA
uniref:DMT family transporter n=1 Tax=Salinivibrio sp. HTSP TaxID=2115977 RepID=UPI0013904C8E